MGGVAWALARACVGQAWGLGFCGLRLPGGRRHPPSLVLDCHKTLCMQGLQLWLGPPSPVRGLATGAGRSQPSPRFSYRRWAVPAQSAV